MPSTFFQRFAACAKSQQGMLIMRLSHKDCKSDYILFSEHIKNKSQKICSEEYPEVKKLQLPLNIRDLPNSEQTGFSSERTRDISGTCITAFSCESDKSEFTVNDGDVRTEKYSCLASVNLSSSMQTNVPYPFRGKAKITHLNMPGGQMLQQAKYISDQLHNFHPVSNTVKTELITTGMEKSKTSLPQTDLEPTQRASSMLLLVSKRFFSAESKNVDAKEIGNANLGQTNKLTKKERLKAAVKEYGAVFIVLHVTLSLTSLGICYTLISSGLDLEAILKTWGWSEGASTAGTVGPFVVAYATHKVLAPMRISLSLFLAPFVVHYFRKRRITPKSK